MSLDLDAAKVVADLLQAGGFGSQVATPPTLYVDAFPAEAPDILVAVAHVGDGDLEPYLGRAGGLRVDRSVEVLLRGERETRSTVKTRANSAWTYVEQNATTSLPAGVWRIYPESLPEPRTVDGSERPAYGFRVVVNMAGDP